MFGFEVASGVHEIESGHGFEGADEQASGLAFGFARDVQAVMESVDEVDVGATGWAEENFVALGDAAIGVCGGIGDAEIGFDLDDASGAKLFPFAADEEFAEKIWRDLARIANVECGRKNTPRNQRRAEWGTITSTTSRKSITMGLL